MQKYCVIDVETTGPNRSGQKITEIAVILTDGKEVFEEFSSLVNPERHIPSRISYLAGITNEMVENAPKFYEVAKKIIQMTEGNIFVAHNVFFDYQFIQREFSELGFSYRRKLFCTVKNARRSFPGLPSYSLKNLTTHFNIELKNHHRALSDTRATFELFKIIKQKSESPLLQSKATPSNLNEDSYINLPQAIGVYYLYDNNGKLLYIGKSKNIRNRIKSHFRLDLKRKKDIELKAQISQIEFKIYPHDLVAQIMESMEIKKNRPPYNVALRRNYYRYEVKLNIDHENFYYFHHQAARDNAIPSKSRRHSERIINLLNIKAFGQSHHFVWKKTLPQIDYNQRLKKVYDYYFYSSDNFTKRIELDSFPISFHVSDGILSEITYQDKVSKDKRRP
jgi:DNA polymerase III subunit epsilon